MKEAVKALHCIGLTSIVVITIVAIMLEKPMTEGIFLTVFIAGATLAIISTLILSDVRVVSGIGAFFASIGVLLSTGLAISAGFNFGKTAAMCVLGVLIATTLILCLWMRSWFAKE